MEISRRPEVHVDNVFPGRGEFLPVAITVHPGNVDRVQTALNIVSTTGPVIKVEQTDTPIAMKFVEIRADQNRRLDVLHRRVSETVVVDYESVARTELDMTLNDGGAGIIVNVYSSPHVLMNPVDRVMTYLPYSDGLR